MKLSTQVKISITSAICLLALAVALKNIIKIPAETLSRDIILYIFIYSIFGIGPSLSKERAEENAKYWYAAIIIATIGIILVYAL